MILERFLMSAAFYTIFVFLRNKLFRLTDNIYNHLTKLNSSPLNFSLLNGFFFDLSIYSKSYSSYNSYNSYRRLERLRKPRSHRYFKLLVCNKFVQRCNKFVQQCYRFVQKTPLFVTDLCKNPPFFVTDLCKNSFVHIPKLFSVYLKLKKG